MLNLLGLFRKISLATARRLNLGYGRAEPIAVPSCHWSVTTAAAETQLTFLPDFPNAARARGAGRYPRNTRQGHSRIE